MKNFKAYIFTTALAALLIFQQGCSKQIAPDPPRTRSRLTLELFDALQNKDHKTALAKVERLKSIDKTNLYLANLYNIEIENIAIIEAEKALENYEPHKAVAILDDAMKAHKQSDALMDAKAKILSLLDLSASIRELQNPTSSLKMAEAAVALKNMSDKDKSLKIFNSYINDRIKEVLKLEREENAQAHSSLAADIKTNARTGSGITSYMIAELVVESPNDPLVKEYIAFLKSKENNSVFSKSILE